MRRGTTNAGRVRSAPMHRGFSLPLRLLEERLDRVVEFAVAQVFVADNALVVEDVDRRQVADVPLLADRPLPAVEERTPVDLALLHRFLHVLPTVVEVNA